MKTIQRMRIPRVFFRCLSFLFDCCLAKRCNVLRYDKGQLPNRKSKYRGIGFKCLFKQLPKLDDATKKHLTFVIFEGKDCRMTYKRLYNVRDTKLIITLPPEFKDKQVLITVDDKVSGKEQNIELMRQAAKDPLYLSDLREVNDDFAGIDHENL